MIYETQFAKMHVMLLAKCKVLLISGRRWSDLQAISKIDLLVECHEKNLESLRGAVGLFDSFKRKALCTLWGYVTALVYSEVG